MMPYMTNGTRRRRGREYEVQRRERTLQQIQEECALNRERIQIQREARSENRFPKQQDRLQISPVPPKVSIHLV